MPHDYEILDVFTDTPLAGNPLAVVYDAGDLDAARMQRIAGEFNLSETIFVRPPADPANQASGRIFTTTVELPFAGHPTVGAAVALAARLGVAEVAVELPAGVVRCTVTPGTVARAAFDAPRRPELTGAQSAPAAVAAALGLPVNAIGRGPYGIVGMTSGPSFTLVPLDDPARLGAITLDLARWGDAFAPGHAAAFVVAWAADGSLRARMFAPAMGMAEDPATGSAAVAFAAAFVAAEHPADGRHDIAIRQGVEMGRPSDIAIGVTVAGGAVERVRLSGEAVPVARGMLLL